MSCFSGESAGRYERLKFAWVQLPEAEGESQNPTYYITYGEATSPEARTVQVTGDGVDVTLPVDPVTTGFGGNLPGYVATDGQLPALTFTFRDGSNKTIDSQTPWK